MPLDELNIPQRRPLNNYGTVITSSGGANPNAPVNGSPAAKKNNCAGCTEAEKMAAALEEKNKNENKNSNKNNNMGANDNRSLQAKRYTGWRNYPILPPIQLTATIGAGITNAFFTDSAGLFTTFGGGAGGQAFTTPAGTMTVANLHSFLQTMWIYVQAFNVTSTIAATLNNNLQQIPVDPDGLNKPIVISSSANISNQQFNPLLINNCYAFVLTFADALRLPVTAPGEVVGMTLVPGAVGMYGEDLQNFIDTNPRFAAGLPINCGN